MPRAAALVSLILLCFSIASVSAAPLPASTFSYNASAPMELQVRNTSVQGEVRRQDVSFASPRGGRVHAEIISPANASGRNPGVLFVHWLGDKPDTTNLTEFLPDALALVKDGVTSVLVDAMWSQTDWFTKVRSTATDYQASIKQVIDLRRALDLLLAQPNVDRGRIAYVGHDFGAMYGAVLSGVDERPSYYVLMAGTTTLSEWYLLGKKPRNVQPYVEQMSPLDPLPYLSHSSAQAYFFQFAAKDAYISPQHEQQFFSAAPVPRLMGVYGTDHALASPAVQMDRLAWLRAHLL